MPEKGWIKLHRQLQECPLWYGERFSKGQAWVDLLLLANHRDKKILFNGEMMNVERGQYLTSMVKLAEKWQWSRPTVVKFLNLLEKDKMITRSSDNTKTLITIENYNDYQDIEEDVLQPTLQHSLQPTLQLTLQECCNPLYNPLYTNKNDKNVKNDKNINISSSVSQIVAEWNTLTEYGIKPVSRLSAGTKRYDSLIARLKQYGLADVFKAIDNIRHSDFLQGKIDSKRKWVITFDWFVLPNNFPKVLEGQYSNDDSKSNDKPKSKSEQQIEEQLKDLENRQTDVLSIEEVERMIREEDGNG